MKRYLYIIIVCILIILIIGVVYFVNKNNNDYISAESKVNIGIEDHNVIDTTNMSINADIAEDNGLISNNIETADSNNSNLDNEEIVNKEDVNGSTNKIDNQEKKESVSETTKVESSKQETKVETPEVSKQETKVEIPETSKQEEKEDTQGKQEVTKEEIKETTPQIDFSKYDRYYPALNGGYTCFKKNPEEIAKLRSLLEAAIKEFGYTNVTLVEDSSIISDRYFTANKTNAQNVVYNAEYFTIRYYAETEYTVAADGTEKIFQLRSYTKITGQN